jgi:hypothetical protein
MTEVFVSIDNLEFTKLDLSKDESILMKYTKKIYKIYLKSLRLIHKTLIFLQRLKIEWRLDSLEILKS